MHKNLGKLQQARGHKRRKKVLNRRLKRNPSDLKSFGGVYDSFVIKNIEEQIEQEAKNE